MKEFGVVARPKAPEGYTGIWINIYNYGLGKYSRSQAGGAYKRKIDADVIAKPYRHDCVYVWVKK